MHAKVMTGPQKRALRELGPLATRHGFVLAGGTAVALHLGHRRSIDLDWFTDRPFPDPLTMAANLRAQGVPFESEEVAHPLVAPVERLREFSVDALHPQRQVGLGRFQQKMEVVAHQAAGVDGEPLVLLCLRELRK